MVRSYPTWLASFGGPAVIGAAVWAAMGTITVWSPDAAGTRVVAPAPWWIGAVAALVACGVPGWRRSPVTAVPALLTVGPWLPLPMPAVALIWTGPLAWAPILAALAAAEGSGWLAAIGRWVGADRAARGGLLAAAATLVLGGLTLWSLSPRLPGGDEPHYLVITQSLWIDGDLRIEDNHARRDYAAYFDGTLKPDYINRGKDGAIYSIHAPGVSALVLPAFVVAGLAGAQVTILLLMAATAALVWVSAWRATEDPSAAWFAWAAVFGSATTLLLGVMIFPDSPGAFGAAVAVWLLVRLARAPEAVGARALMLSGATLGALPWLHTRFAVVAAGAGLAIGVALVAARGAAWADRTRRLAWFLMVPVISAAAWFWQFFAIYGTWDPRAPYRGAESIREWITGAVVGLFADQQFGLLAFSPVLVAAVIGVFRAKGRGLRWVCVFCLLLLAGYTAAVASYHMWWAGLPGLPARFLTAVLPLLAVPLAVGWHRATSAGRAVLLALLLVTWGISALVIGWDHGQLAFNFRDGQAAWLEWLNPVVNLPRAWPSFFWRSQEAFLAHVSWWVLVWGVSWVVLRTFVRRHSEDAGLSRVAVAVWLLAGVMAGAAIGWSRHGVTGLDPARSQLAVLAQPVLWRVDALSVARVSAAQMAVRPDEPPLSDAPSPWVMVVGPVPPGEYVLDLDAAPVAPIAVAVRVCRTCEALAVAEVVPSGPIALTVTLPLGAAAVMVEVDRARAADAKLLKATLRPRQVSGAPTRLARASVTRGGATWWFADDGAFVEADGFWVRGGAATIVAWAAGRAQAGRTRPLVIRNGGAANTITVSVGAWQQSVSLAPWEERAISLPQADATGTWRVGLRSSAGFRPADVSGGDDRRYLGVWVPF